MTISVIPCFPEKIKNYHNKCKMLLQVVVSAILCLICILPQAIMPAVRQAIRSLKYDNTVHLLDIGQKTTENTNYCDGV